MLFKAIFLFAYLGLSYLVATFIYNSQIKFYEKKEMTKKGSSTPFDIHKEFDEFSRHDRIDFIPLLIGTIFLFWIRFIVSILLAIILMIILTIKLGHLKTKGVVSHEERKSFKKIIGSITTCIFYASGILVKYHRVDCKDVYEEYFGKDYKIEYDSGFAGYICNHTSFIDTLLGMRYLQCGYMAKSAVRDSPVIGNIAVSFQSLFVDRGNQQDRDRSLHQVEERFSGFLNGKIATPLLIYPEGTTTSGRNLLKFKRGAFYPLLPIKPMMVKPNLDPLFNLGCGSSDVFINYMRGLTKLFTVIEYIELPIMKPTEYMFENYKNLGKEKWEIYSEVAREIYCKIGGFEKCNGSLRDSTRYSNSLDTGVYVEKEELQSN